MVQRDSDGHRDSDRKILTNRKEMAENFHFRFTDTDKFTIRGLEIGLNAKRQMQT